MKGYTNLEQSKKLAEILPLESADMRYTPLGDMTHPWVWTDTFIEKDAVPCWSLAALLDVLPYPTLYQQGDGVWGLDVWVEHVKPYSEKNAICEIDACVAMIERLHEQKLL